MLSNASWAWAVGHTRPYFALLSMKAEDRALIAERLNFKFPGNVSGNPEEEAKHILWRNLRGIVARIHGRYEMIMPGENFTWRQVLISVLESQVDGVFDATMTTPQLEKLYLTTVMGGNTRRSTGKKSFYIPNVPVKGGKAAILMELIKSLDSMLEGLLATTDGPALSVMVPICYVLVESDPVPTVKLTRTCPRCSQIITDLFVEGERFACPQCDMVMDIVDGEMTYEEELLTYVVKGACPSCGKKIQGSYNEGDIIDCTKCATRLCVTSGKLTTA